MRFLVLIAPVAIALTACGRSSGGGTAAAAPVGPTVSGLWMYHILSFAQGINLEPGVAGSSVYLTDVRLTALSDGSAEVEAAGVNSPKGGTPARFSNAFYMPAKAPLTVDYDTFIISTGDEADNLGTYIRYTVSVAPGANPTLKASVDNGPALDIPLTQ